MARRHLFGKRHPKGSARPSTAARTTVSNLVSVKDRADQPLPSLFDGQVRWLAERGMFFPAITDPVRDHQILPWKTNGHFVDLGIGFVALHGDHGADGA